MLSLTQGRRLSASQGAPIPTPFKSFQHNGIHFRKGSLSLVAAAPGAGKSALVQSIVQRGDGDGGKASAFYFSADSTANEVFTRAAAMATGYQLGEVERLMAEGGQDMLEAAVKSEAGHVRYSFKSSLTLDDVDEELAAYATVYGAFPDIIVVDNLMDLDAGMDDEFRNLGEASLYLKDTARLTGAAVIALHHVGGEHENGGKPIPLGGLRGKVSKIPALVLTLHRASGLKVSVVKNRSGKADPSGNYGVELSADLSRMWFDG